MILYLATSRTTILPNTKKTMPIRIEGKTGAMEGGEVDKIVIEDRS